MWKIRAADILYIVAEIRHAVMVDQKKNKFSGIDIPSIFVVSIGYLFPKEMFKLRY